jgi:Do/DeqQ family serine protease
MNLRNRSVLAGAALVAVGAVAGAWVTAKTGQFPFSYEHVPAAAQTKADLDVSFRSGFGPVVKAVQPAVVSITSTTKPREVSRNRRGNGGQSQIPPELRDFFGGNLPFNFDFDTPQNQGPRTGLGSGVIVSPDGYILTNHHVIDEADQVRVALHDGREFTAKVVGSDADNDVAVLKVEGKDLPSVPIGNSDSVQVGDIVLALGNPFGLGETVTMGIVGATHRNTPPNMAPIENYEDFIQTDAAINPGNSGGALVNLKGEVIGINTAILSRSGGNQGVGFAIPGNTAKNVFDQIVKHGKVSRGFMGISPQDVTPVIAKQFGFNGSRGALVADVTSGGAADKAGVKSGDIITEVNGQRVSGAADLRVKVGGLNPGTATKLKIFRDGGERELSVTLGSRPNEERASNDSATEKSSDGPRLGIGVEPRKNGSGLTITNVEQGSAADEAGLRPGDVILEVNRKSISDMASLQSIVRGSKGDPVLLYVERTNDRNPNGRGKGETTRQFLTIEPR